MLFTRQKKLKPLTSPVPWQFIHISKSHFITTHLLFALVPVNHRPSWVPPTLPSWNEHGGIERRPRPGDLDLPIETSRESRQNNCDENNTPTSWSRHGQPERFLAENYGNLKWCEVSKSRIGGVSMSLCLFLSWKFNTAVFQYWTPSYLHAALLTRDCLRLSTNTACLHAKPRHQNNQCIPWYPETISENTYTFTI